MDRPTYAPHDARSEVAAAADFSILRYAQCWEDTEVVLEALAIRPGHRCFSIGSGGDNSLAMLSRDPGKVVAVDLSPAQIALIELKAAAFRRLTYHETLQLAGIEASPRRLELYQRLRGALSASACAYWDRCADVIRDGVSSAGKFERYFGLFRRFVLPLVHSQADIAALFVRRSPSERRRFYDERWNNRRWRLLFELFFSRAAMGRLGRDPEFFRFVEGAVAARVLERTRHALVDLDPSDNPYLRWIVYGRYADRLPYVWREENFVPIRRNIDRLDLRVDSVEAFLGSAPESSYDAFNMSDIFEYISDAASEQVFDQIARCARPSARVAYWNMMAPRRRPQQLAAVLRTLDAESEALFRRAHTFFYGAFYVDQVCEPT